MLELNDRLADEQNGFRRGRCTGDHITSLSMIVKSRIKLKRDTFASFIDFSKAYDRIDRSLLWHKLSQIGIDGKMLIRSLKSLYENVKCTVRLNGFHSEWFDVNTGLKQGCVLSPLFFNAFVTDLILAIKSLDCGIPIFLESSISILLYADDIVLLSKSEANMQIMLDYLDKWCETWGLTIIFNKSKVMHLRALQH